MRNIFLFIFVLSTLVSKAQETFNVNGSHNKNHNYYAFTNATIHVDYQTTIEKGTLLIQDGKIVVAAQEERFTRKKHDTSFPINSIEYCLKSQNLTIKDIDYIAFYEKPLLKFERLLYQHLQYFPKSYKIFLSNMPSWFNEKLRILKTIKKKLKYKKNVLFVEHHMAHAAGSFFPSPFKKSAIITIDGVGEWTTTSYGVGNINKINLLKHINFPHSIGLLYSTLTAYLGFSVNNSEYKVMGLSSYGNLNRKTNIYYNKLKNILEIKKDGSYKLKMDFFSYPYKNKMPSKIMSSFRWTNKEP